MLGFQEIVANEPALLIEGLWDAPKAALIAKILKSTGKSILVITGETRETKLLDDLPYFGVEAALELPSWETLPGEEIAPSADIVGKRFEILNALMQRKNPFLLLAPLQACLQKLPAPATASALFRQIKTGDELPFETLRALFSSLGYVQVPVVSEKGEFAVRGGLVDIFPLSAEQPYRLDFFGNTIESIRAFDPNSQKTIAKTTSFLLTPAKENELLKKEKKLSLLFDYLSASGTGRDTLVIFDDLLALEDRYVALKSLPGFSSKFFLTIEELMEAAAPLQKLFWAKERAEELSETQMKKRVGRAYYTGKAPLQALKFEIFGCTVEAKRWKHPFQEVSDFFAPVENTSAATPLEILHGIHRLTTSISQLHLITSTPSEEKTLQEMLEKEKIQLPRKTSFERGYLSSGYVLPEEGIILLPMTELTHRLRVRRQKWRAAAHTPPSEFHQLSPGDVVVHFHQGIAKYLGVEKKKNHLGQEAEFLVLEYAESSKLYVPMNQSHLVSRYIGAGEEMPTFSTLGSGRWQKTRQRAEKSIIGYAHDLLRMSAEREVRGGFAFPEDGEEMRSFESDFPFEETEDQLLAIAAVKKEMCSTAAMDRLVCGDVGYGKTEVAMRAAFKAVVDGKKQVAVLVPTTVLAMQHYETFKERMANYPINIAFASRFASAKEIKETLKKVEDGGVDILIGTHRLISKDVRFKDLGLIIIDEEQRFGVRAKEHLKALKVGVDCITLSATPIPRTLYMTLIGAKEISLINTPPQDRLPIKTIIAARENHTIQNALLRELSRDGQAFFIHNRVESILHISDEIQKLLPEARIVTGHGQMSAEEIDAIFHAFKGGSADILVATTIIENGIDIPNANTILIDRAETFGLADLYQLRGRVGRWNRPAYAYFLVPPNKQLHEIAKRRLNALVEAAGFGGGMKIAMRDLELRGAGDILGVEQSGQVSAIGFHLYCKLLKRTVEALKSKTSPSFVETKMEFSFPAFLPEAYIAEPSLRMEIYHRLGEAQNNAEIDALLAEIKDRFGPPPPQVFWLYHLTRVRLFASQRHFTLLKFETYTLFAEQQKGKEVVKKTILLKQTKDPARLEQEVIEKLQ